MMNSVLDQLSKEIINFVTNLRLASDGFLIKKHTEHLEKLGDVSFPCSSRSWQHNLSNHISEKECSALLEKVISDPDSIVRESAAWVLSLRSAVQIKDRLHFYLDRSKAIRAGLLEALSNHETIARKLKENPTTVHLDLLCVKTNCVTSLRLYYLTKAIGTLYSLSENCQQKKPSIFITTKSTSESTGRIKILCGAVLNVHTNAKETNISSEEFIQLRQNEMTLIAQHKYGVRATSDSKWKEFLAHLGESAVVYELLQIKPSSAIKINFECSSGSSKGASFILYNCARVETMIRTFKEKVDEGIYPPLPNIEDVDFNLLNQEDEWSLVYNYIIGLPLLLKQSVELKDNKCEFRPHLICAYLNTMVSVFSQYYRKVRILTEPRKHLLPVMFARLHMITILNETLKICLKLLNIKSVTQMYNNFFSILYTISLLSQYLGMVRFKKM